MHGGAVPRGGEGKDQDVCPLCDSPQGGAYPHGGSLGGLGKAILPAAKGADGVAQSGEAAAEVEHTQVSPDDGEAAGGAGNGCRIGHGWSLLSGGSGSVQDMTGERGRVRDEFGIEGNGGNYPSDTRIC